MRPISEGASVEHSERPWLGQVEWVSPPTDYRPDNFTPPTVALVRHRTGLFAGMVYAENVEQLRRAAPKLKAVA